MMLHFVCAFVWLFYVNTSFATAYINGNETVCTISDLIVNKWEERKWDTSDKRPLSALMVVWLDGQLGILSQFVFSQKYNFYWKALNLYCSLFKTLTFDIRAIFKIMTLVGVGSCMLVCFRYLYFYGYLPLNMKSSNPSNPVVCCF